MGNHQTKKDKLETEPEKDLLSTAFESSAKIQIQSKTELTDTQSLPDDSGKRDKLINLYYKIRLDLDLYIDIDTLRKNKSSAISRKKPTYIDHQLRLFSNQKPWFDQARKIIKVLIRNNGGLQSDQTDLRGSIISYVEGDIEFHDLMTNSIRLFNSESDKRTNPPIGLLDLYQAAKFTNPSIQTEGQIKIRDKRPRSRAIIRPADRQIVATRKDKEDAIPASTRKIVWREEFKNGQKPRCYCCHTPLTYDQWHCGHILSRKEGGRIEKENLHPVCIGCNLGMGVNHMYEYILVNQLPGKKSLDFDHPIVLMMQQVAFLIHYSWASLERLKESGYITATEAKKYREMIVSSKKTLSERMSIMINISQYEMRIPSLIS